MNDVKEDIEKSPVTEKPNKRKFFQLNRRQKLGWERFKFGNELGLYVSTIAFLLLSILLVVSLTNALRKEEDIIIAISLLIPVILAFQLLVVIIQTVNQRQHNKVMKMGVVPSFSVYIEKTHRINNRGRKVGEYWSMRLLNSGTDAHNVSYRIKEDDKEVITNIPYFLFKGKEDKEIQQYSKKDTYLKKQVEIYIGFEDIVKSPRCIAYFRKEAKEEGFTTISTGIR